MKKLFFLAALAATYAAPAAVAGDCPGGCGGGHFAGPHAGKYTRFTGWFHGGGHAPKLQAAPWYVYWPYNGHFMTPAPMAAPFVPPPAMGGMVNPYFPH
jgi:hypothetical protein